MNIQVLGAHNCESQNSKLLSILIDDVLAMDAGGLTSSLSLPAQQKIKSILITHHHYDHVRDIPAIAMNLFLQNNTTNVYSTQPVYDTITTYLLNDRLYPNFLKRPPEKPTIKFTVVEPHQTKQIESYSILAVPVNHTDPALGYQVTAPDGKTVFYTGDTGPGLTDCWEYISPQLIIIEVTASNRFEEWAGEGGHLTPSLLKQELTSFREVKGYLPRVITVHMNPDLEKETAAEIAVVAQALNNSITPAYEGMRIQL